MRCCFEPDEAGIYMKVEQGPSILHSYEGGADTSVRSILHFLTWWSRPALQLSKITGFSH